ncbi:hypothetical protein KIPB_009603, partial [Kipferlia bialata]|eukprot:g9603.t1
MCAEKTLDAVEVMASVDAEALKAEDLIRYTKLGPISRLLGSLLVVEDLTDLSTVLGAEPGAVEQARQRGLALASKAQTSGDDASGCSHVVALARLAAAYLHSVPGAGRSLRLASAEYEALERNAPTHGLSLAIARHWSVSHNVAVVMGAQALAHFDTHAAIDLFSKAHRLAVRAGREHLSPAISLRALARALAGIYPEAASDATDALSRGPSPPLSLVLSLCRAAMGDIHGTIDAVEEGLEAAGQEERRQREQLVEQGLDIEGMEGALQREGEGEGEVSDGTHHCVDDLVVVRVLCHAATGHLDAAIQEMEQVVHRARLRTNAVEASEEVPSEYLSPHLSLYARLLILQGDVDQGKSLLRSAFAMVAYNTGDPEWSPFPPLPLPGTIAATLVSVHALEVSTAHWWSDEYDDALGVLQVVSDAYPRCFEADLRLARLWLGLGNLEEASNAMVRLCARHPSVRSFREDQTILFLVHKLFGSGEPRSSLRPYGYLPDPDPPAAAVISLS